ncbi:hypothetical protein NDU88_001791 [Pleurodeles waltl]|uniref:Uncharacterized protein n=1 Tax=Pleurodeles waltl TaxID=8319 RepID=A0AAV7LAT2_PLEWA|nr:hypothetical protein NDU88_001791 [Pleurodeles waltl]
MGASSQMEDKDIAEVFLHYYKNAYERVHIVSTLSLVELLSSARLPQLAVVQKTKLSDCIMKQEVAADLQKLADAKASGSGGIPRGGEQRSRPAKGRQEREENTKKPQREVSCFTEKKTVRRIRYPRDPDPWIKTAGPGEHSPRTCHASGEAWQS